MNDADLNENIGEHAENAENQLPKEYRFQNDEVHLYPSRWWFASSAFPMIAGTLGPVASAFSICALARPWRQQLVPGGDITKAGFFPDPPWLVHILKQEEKTNTFRLIIVNAIQLAVAVVANAFLLLNMARRVRFGIAQPVTIVGWYTSSILLIALCGTAAGPLRAGLPFPEEECVWSQAFWYGIWAAVLYFVNASLMAVTFWGSWTGRYGKDFILTTSQRTLMLQTVVYLFYLLLGALVFSDIEGWNYLDGVYWANVTLFTIGFGDYSPQTKLGQALVIPYALVGVISLGLVIASIRSLLLERGRKRVDARMEEKKRRQTVRSMAQRGQDSVLEPIIEERALSTSPNSQETVSPANEYERRRAEFDLMRKIQEQAGTRRKWVAMGTSAGTWLVLWLVGAAIFQQCEMPYQHWSYFTAFYFCFASFTTIGYGTDVPVSPAGKSFFVLWSLLALPTMTVLISNAGDTVVKFVRDATIRLGNITILPGEDSFMGEVMHIISKISGGILFKEYYTFPKPNTHQQFIAHIEELNKEQASLEEPEQQQHEQQEDRGRSNFLDVERAPERAPSTFTSRVRRSLSRLRDPLDALPTGTEFHFLLISEIQVVNNHMREPHPRRYSFEEWAWYLKLIGEDERDAANHRKPRSKDKRNKHHHHDHEHNGKTHHKPSHDEEDLRHDGVARIRTDDGEELKWSWVGNRSPLMGSQEESEWILDRLTNRLRESLSAERRRQLERRPRGVSRLASRAGIGSRTPSHQDRGLSEKTKEGD